MTSKKQVKTEINLCNISIKLDALALDSHPIDIKQGRSVEKRVIKLAFIQDGGIIKAPVHLWMFGWLKGLFKSKAIGTTVYLPDKMPAWSLGSAKDILIGKTEKQWKETGDRNVVYELDEDLAKLKLWPFHNFVPLGGRMGSATKYFYECNSKMAPVQLLIYTMIPTDLLIDNMKNLGKVYGIGPKGNGYRLGTFTVIDSKVSKIGEIAL